MRDINLSKVIPSTKYGRLTLFAVLIEAIIIIILESVVAAIFWTYNKDIPDPGQAKGIPVYLIIFILAQLFQIFLCWDAVVHQNTIQIIGFNAFNLSVCLYSIFQIIQMSKLITTIATITAYDERQVKGALIAIPVVVAVFQVLFAWFAWKLYAEFGWKIYKKIGADPKMRNMYRVYQIFLMLLKLDIFFVSGFGIQFLVLVIQNTDPEFALSIAALPIMIIILALAVYGVKREDKWIMGLFCFGLLLAMSYFIFKLVRIWQRREIEPYKNTKNYLTFFATLSLAVVLLTLVNAVFCIRNFGKGLRQHIANSKPAVTELSTGQRRISLE